MFSYALKRLVRGGGIFLALFLSVTLAATLFSGILQGADAVGMSMLEKVLEATDIDIVSSAENRNLTKTSLSEVEEAIASLEHVVRVEHLIRSIKQEARYGIEVNVTGVNASMPFTIVAIASNSSLVDGIVGVERLEPGMVYIDVGSVNATLFQTGDQVTLTVPTYVPGGSLVDIQKRSAHFAVGGVVEIDDRLYSIAMGEYPSFLGFLFRGISETGRRPLHQLIIISEETFLGWMHQIYAERRRHTRALIAETVIGLDRDKLLNPWNIAGSAEEVKLVFERINSLGARFGYVPVNYLGVLLDSISVRSSLMKTSTMLVAAPVFFTAWYLGFTVSDMSLGLRRREIGLLFTRGLTHGQVFYIFLFEALLVSLFAGASGILLGAAIIPFVIPGMGVLQVFRSLSPVTIAISFTFSCALAVIAVYRPAKRAVSLDIVDALREYQSEDEGKLGSWHEPLLALSLGAYSVAMLLMGLTVEQFRPATGNLIVFLLYSTWWGVDFILTYIAPILFFWGFTKLFIQYFPWFHSLLGRLAGALVGDIALFSTLSARRNARRTATITFMAALIVGYSVSVIGGIASTDDFMERDTRLSIVGADASVWLYQGDDAEDLRDEIAELEGVASATVETWFEAESSLGVIKVRIIDPLEWKEIAYIEEGWLGEADAFERMSRSEAVAMMERGAAALLGVEVDTPMIIKLGSKIHTFTIVGLYGREPGPGWAPQNPTLYIPDTFEVRDKYLGLTRILVKFEEGSDVTGFADEVEALDPDIEGVDIAMELIRGASSNVFLAGPRRVEELGVYFSALVSSLGVVLVISTALRSRWKELTVMAIRGFSTTQLALTLLVENIGMTIFAVALGLGIGSVMLLGETEIINATVSAVLQRRVVFPPSAQMSLAFVVGLLILSTVAPIILAVRQVSEHPTWRTEE